MEELDLLKQRADVMGIKYSPNIGVDALKAKIAEAANSTVAGEEPVSTTESITEIRQRMLKEELKLVRIRVANLNPDKKDLQGEIFTVGNRLLGMHRKFVPYGEATDEGYHVPYIIYKQLKARKFLQKRTFMDKQTQQIRVETKWVAEFALEVLPQLTQEELNTLATNQAAKGGIA